MALISLIAYNDGFYFSCIWARFHLHLDQELKDEKGKLKWDQSYWGKKRFALCHNDLGDELDEFNESGELNVLTNFEELS